MSQIMVVAQNANIDLVDNVLTPHRQQNQIKAKNKQA